MSSPATNYGLRKVVPAVDDLADSLRRAIDGVNQLVDFGIETMKGWIAREPGGMQVTAPDADGNPLPVRTVKLPESGRLCTAIHGIATSDVADSDESFTLTNVYAMAPVYTLWEGGDATCLNENGQGFSAGQGVVAIRDQQSWDFVPVYGGVTNVYASLTSSAYNAVSNGSVLAEGLYEGGSYSGTMVFLDGLYISGDPPEEYWSPVDGTDQDIYYDTPSEGTSGNVIIGAATNTSESSLTSGHFTGTAQLQVTGDIQSGGNLIAAADAYVGGYLEVAGTVEFVGEISLTSATSGANVNIGALSDPPANEGIMLLGFGLSATHSHTVVIGSGVSDSGVYSITFGMDGAKLLICYPDALIANFNHINLPNLPRNAGSARRD